MIHQYKLNGYNLVLDVDSGGVHVVDDLVYDIIALFENKLTDEIVRELSLRWSPNEIRDAIEDVKALVDAGTLFSQAQHQERLRSRETGSDPVIKALCLNVAHTCNLNCCYCFASQGTYKGEQAVMPLSTGKRAMDFLVEKSGTRRNLEVDFFGGEPLLNWEMVKDTVAYARSLEEIHNKHFRFTITTNGLLIDDDVIEFTNREMDNVVLSLDGRKEVHNRFRVTKSGAGCYDIVVPKFQELVRRRTRGTYYVRGTYTHFNTDFLEDIIHMADLGFDELSMEPVVCPPDEPYALTASDMPILKEQYELLAKEMIARDREGRGFRFYHFTMDLDHGPCIYKRVAGCGSGTEYLAVTPIGEIYPCHQLVDNRDFLMGNLWDGITRTDLQDDFSQCNVFAREACRDCWAKLYCSGGCAANAYHVSGSLLGVDSYGCELFKKRIECALMTKAAQAIGDTNSHNYK